MRLSRYQAVCRAVVEGIYAILGLICSGAGPVVPETDRGPRKAGLAFQTRRRAGSTKQDPAYEPRGQSRPIMRSNPSVSPETYVMSSTHTARIPSIGSVAQVTSSTGFLKR